MKTIRWVIKNKRYPEYVGINLWGYTYGNDYEAVFKFAHLFSSKKEAVNFIKFHEIKLDIFELIKIDVE